MQNKFMDSNIVSTVLGSGLTLIVVFIGPLRTMATQDDIRDFATKTDVRSMIPQDGYIEDRKLLMDYVKRLDTISRQMESLGREISALQTEIKYLRKELPKNRS